MNDACPTLRLKIEPGQTLLRRLAGGSRIAVMTGAVRVEGPPQWLAETLLSAVSIVRSGSVLELPQAGWVTLRSEGAADVVIDRLAARPNAVQRALRAVVLARRRRIHSASSPSHAA